MENLTVTRTNCNTFVFSYSDNVKDLTINIREVSLISDWDGNLSLLPIYLTIVIPHIISPSIIPNTYTLELPSDKIYAFEFITNETWYLPSTDELTEMANILAKNHIGNFITTAVEGTEARYWTSTEDGMTRPAPGHPSIGKAYYVSFDINDIGTVGTFVKEGLYHVRPIRKFISALDLTIGSETQTGYIFYKHGITPNILYLECAKQDITTLEPWSNLETNSDQLGTTMSGFNTGLENTLKIINQVGHTTSAAASAYLNFNYLHTYSIYSIFCELINCRLDLLKRVLGELDNCKEECDCIAVYDYNAFSVIYEAIVSLYENIFSILNIDMLNSTLTADEIETLTTFEELMIQYKKYCVSCEKPCKNC